MSEEKKTQPSQLKDWEIEINKLLHEAHTISASAVDPLAKAASIAMLNKHFMQGKAIADRGIQMQQASGGCYAQIFGGWSPQSQKSVKEQLPEAK